MVAAEAAAAGVDSSGAVFMWVSLERRLAAAPERTPARVRPRGFALPGWWLLEVSGERKIGEEIARIGLGEEEPTSVVNHGRHGVQVDSGWGARRVIDDQRRSRRRVRVHSVVVVGGGILLRCCYRKA